MTATALTLTLPHVLSWEKDGMDFSRHMVEARALEMKVNGTTLHLRPKVFSTGSVGWYFSGKVDIDGTLTQASLSLVVIGSKPGTQPAPVATKAEAAPKAPQRPARTGKAKKVNHPAPSPASPENGQDLPLEGTPLYIGGPGSLLEPEA